MGVISKEECRKKTKAVKPRIKPKHEKRGGLDAKKRDTKSMTPARRRGKARKRKGKTEATGAERNTTEKKKWGCEAHR